MQKKQNSVSVVKATTRIAALASIDPVLDLGNGNSLAAFKTLMEESRIQLDTYNTLLSQADEAATRFQQKEAELNDWAARMLAAVAVRYGRDSIEYQKAGGTRISDRRRPATNHVAVTGKVGVTNPVTP